MLGVVELLFQECKVSVMPDNYLTAICCTYIVPIVNNMVLCISKYVERLDLILSILNTYTQTQKHTQKHKNTMEGVGFFYYLDCGDGIKGLYVSKCTKLYTLNM